MDTIAQLLKLGRETLTPVSPTASLDSELLLAEAIGRPRSHLYAWPQLYYRFQFDIFGLMV